MGIIRKSDILIIAEDNGWEVSFEEQSCNGRSEKYAEFRQCSPAGEDYSFTAFYDDIAGLIREVAEVAADFDEEEHIEMWVEARHNGVGGVPSISDLVADAADIQNMLDTLSDSLFKLL